MVDCMPNRISSMAIAKQIVRSGTSPAANYRAACLGKSDKDFLNKLKMVEEELDETIHWLEIIAESEMIPANKLLGLQQEAHELYKIIVSSIVTTRNRLAKEELDETIHWLEIIAESEMIPANKLLGLQQEAHELYKIIVSSIVTTRNRLAKEV